jgi:hypothetical protein
MRSKYDESLFSFWFEGKIGQCSKNVLIFLKIIKIDGKTGIIFYWLRVLKRWS